MRLPIIPFIIAITILGIAVYLFNVATSAGPPSLDAPRIARLIDVQGMETEVAVSPDGLRCAVIADGDLWIVTLADGSSSRITETTELESFPAWSPDGNRIAFTRGADTFVISSKTGGNAEPFRTDATFLSWSASGRLAFVRNRGLWLTDASGRQEKQVVTRDDNPLVTIRSPRFSDDSLQIAFIKTLPGLTGQVWIANAANGTSRMLIGDRMTENPLDIGWILDGRELVYLTDRSGALSIWHINFAENSLAPLTQPLMNLPMAPIGISVWKNRIVMPRHFIDSNITVSDGAKVAQSDDIEFEPASSPDGRLVAYTIAKENNFKIWTAGIDGDHPTFRTGGREPRFSPDGFHILYTHADLLGNDDIWRMDIRTGESERLTDADELDLSADASNDGQWIAFASTRGVAPSIWVTPASGGKRLRIHDGGYNPRFSPNSQSILFWQDNSFWMMNSDGGGPHTVMPADARPSIGVWLKNEPLRLAGSEIRNAADAVLFKSEKPLWPQFDVLPDGRFLIAPIDVRETSLWAIDLTFKTQ